MGLPRQEKQNSPHEFKANSQLCPRGAEPERCSVAIRPGGMLQLIYWEEKGDETSHWSRLDISAKAAQFLFYPTLIEGTVTLGDIFRILYRDPVLSVVFANDLPSEPMSMAFSHATNY